MIAKATRVRRTQEQLIADLETKIATLKARATRARVERDPIVRFITGAVKSIDKAMAETEDRVLRTALDEARSTLTACLALKGIVPSIFDFDDVDREAKKTACVFALMLILASSGMLLMFHLNCLITA